MTQADDSLFRHEYVVRYHELDSCGNLRPLGLLNYMQDTAGMHALRLGVSVTDLHQCGLTWVLSRLHLVIDRYPRADELVCIHTWPSTRQGLFTCREFEMMNQAQQIYARATTSWAALNLKTRRPVRLDEHLPSYPLREQRAVQDDFATLPVLPPDAELNEISFRVLRGDLDINRHVNNAVYVAWALETVPDSVAAGMLSELEISYRSEALYGETVLSRCVVESRGATSCCLHQIFSQADGRELVRLRSCWRSP